jgi:hypothetical protein
MFSIEDYLPNRKKVSPNGWISFDCPVCHLHGHGRDKRMRGGLRVEAMNWGYNCFNCNHRAKFTLGEQLSDAAKQLLTALGMDEADLNAINLASLRFKESADFSVAAGEVPIKAAPKFEEVTINAPMLDIYNPEHQVYVEYLKNRCIDPTSYPFLIGTNKNRPGIIIPFTHRGVIVGHTTRFLDNHKPKYLNETQTGYVFGFDLQKYDWNIALLMEGPFCALSLNGLAIMHQTISDDQSRLLRTLRKEIVVIPDQNSSGLELIDRAMELGYSVSIPEWGEGIEDVNEAICKYGRIAVLVSILKAREHNELKIKLRRKWLAKRVRD